MHYLKNLLTALCGRNPYQIELDKMREQYEQTADRVETLSDMYYSVQQKKSEADAMLSEYARKLTDYQTLVENLRERVSEKDAMIARMKEDFTVRTDGYKRRIEDYSGQVARLQGELAKVRKRASRANASKKLKKEDGRNEK